MDDRKTKYCSSPTCIYNRTKRTTAGNTRVCAIDGAEIVGTAVCEMYTQKDFKRDVHNGKEVR